MDKVIQAAAEAVDDARLTLTRAYAANDPEIKEIVAVALKAADAARAEDVRAAVQEVIRKAVAFGRADYLLDQVALGGKMGFDDARSDLIEAQIALLQLCGIEPKPYRVTESASGE